jgi:PTH1 family peptidyl-tRNA hydrolase
MRRLKLVVGLGNPGSEYERTRHNAGFRAIDDIAFRLDRARFKRAFRGKFCRVDIPDSDFTLGLLKPQTYMNRSGQSVGRAARELGIETDDLLVVHDDLDLPLGRIRIKAGGGTAGHKGLESIAGALGTKDFLRLRIGIDKPTGSDATDYVLGRFHTDEEVILENDVLPRVIEAVMMIVKEGPERAMNVFNR